jgi:transketolase
MSALVGGEERVLDLTREGPRDGVHPGAPFDAVVSAGAIDRRTLIDLRNMVKPAGRLIVRAPAPPALADLLARAGFEVTAAPDGGIHARKPDRALWVHEPAERLIQERAAAIRRLTLEAIASAGSGHPGGSLSAAEILACLYFDDDPALRVDWDAARADRNRFVLSKGHACPAWYAALHLRGLLPSPVGLLRQLGSPCPGHPEVGTPGVDAPSGSLGNGLSIGVGMALGFRHRRLRRRVYVLLGDGDLNEGATWEAIMYAGVHRLAALTAIVDANGRQGEAETRRVLDLEPLPPKLAAFGWQALEVQGHDIPSLRRALRRAATPERPTVIVARTVKGRGVSFMEDVQRWHGSLAPSPEELARALAEIDETEAAAARQHAGAFYA